VVRPTVFLETWIGLLGEMAATKRAVTVFGRGENPVNFVGAGDVAALVVQATLSAGLDGATLEIGGPENITLNDLARAVLAGRGGVPVRHVPLPVLRALATVLRPVKPSIATLAQFGVIMDTADMTLAADPARAAVPGLPVTYASDVIAATTADGRAHPGPRSAGGDQPKRPVM
jgi:NADH dehydrogenase